MKYLLILSVFLASCAAHIQRDEVGDLRLEWSNASLAGFGIGMTAWLVGPAIAGAGLAENNNELTIAGGVVGVVGVITFLATTIASGVVVGQDSERPPSIYDKERVQQGDALQELDEKKKRLERELKKWEEKNNSAPDE